MMTGRVLLGNRGGGVYGFWVSRPGKDVQTAVAGEFLFSSESGFLQRIMVSGQWNVPSATLPPPPVPPRTVELILPNIGPGVPQLKLYEKQYPPLPTPPYGPDLDHPSYAEYDPMWYYPFIKFEAVEGKIRLITTLYSPLIFHYIVFGGVI